MAIKPNVQTENMRIPTKITNAGRIKQFALPTPKNKKYKYKFANVPTYSAA